MWLGLINELMGLSCAAPTAAAVCPSAPAPIKAGWPQPHSFLSSLLSSKWDFSYFLKELWCPNTRGKWHFPCCSLGSVWCYSILRVQIKVPPWQEAAGLCLD